MTSEVEIVTDWLPQSFYQTSFLPVLREDYNLQDLVTALSGLHFYIIINPEDFKKYSLDQIVSQPEFSAEVMRKWAGSRALSGGFIRSCQIILSTKCPPGSLIY